MPTKGCTPEDRETETEFASVPVTAPASESQSSSSMGSVPVCGKAVLGIMLMKEIGLLLHIPNHVDICALEILRQIRRFFKNGRTA